MRSPRHSTWLVAELGVEWDFYVPSGRKGPGSVCIEEEQGGGDWATWVRGVEWYRRPPGNFSHICDLGPSAQLPFRAKLFNVSLFMVLVSPERVPQGRPCAFLGGLPRRPYRLVHPL